MEFNLHNVTDNNWFAYKASWHPNDAPHTGEHNNDFEIKVPGSVLEVTIADTYPDYKASIERGCYFSDPLE